MSEVSNTCPTCNNEIKENWRYCRHCGQALTQNIEPEITVMEPEVFVTDQVSTPEIPTQPDFDRDLYHKVLSSREKRLRLSKQKKKLKEDISALLIQLQSKVINRDYATTQINELKINVASVNDQLSEFKDLPQELPVEILNDEIDASKAKIRKLEKLKSDETISKDAIKTEKVKAIETLHLLEEQKSAASGYLRNWLDDVKKELAKEREDFNSLNIKFKIQEITEETFAERKVNVVDRIEELDGIISMINNLLK